MNRRRRQLTSWPVANCLQGNLKDLLLPDGKTGPPIQTGAKHPPDSGTSLHIQQVDLHRSNSGFRGLKQEHSRPLASIALRPDASMEDPEGVPRRICFNMESSTGDLQTVKGVVFKRHQGIPGRQGARSQPSLDTTTPLIGEVIRL